MACSCSMLAKGCGFKWTMHKIILLLKIVCLKGLRYHKKIKLHLKKVSVFNFFKKTKSVHSTPKPKPSLSLDCNVNILFTPLYNKHLGSNFCK